MNKIQKEITWGIVIALIFFVTIVSAMALEIKINDNLTDTYLFLPNETGVGGVILSATCEALAFFPRYNTTPYFKRTAVEIGNGIYRFNMTSPNETGTHILYGNCTKSNANFVGALEFEVVVEKIKEIINATRNTSLQTYNAVLSTNISIINKLSDYNLSTFNELILLRTTLENMNSTQQNNISTMIAELNVILNEIISTNGAKLNATLLNLSYARNDLSFVLSNQSNLYNEVNLMNISMANSFTSIQSNFSTIYTYFNCTKSTPFNNTICSFLDWLNISTTQQNTTFDSILSNQSRIYNLAYNVNTSIMKNLNDARTDINLTLLNMINMNITQLEKFNSISNNLTIVLNNLSFLIFNISNCSNNWASGDWFCNKLFENYRIVNFSNQTLKSIKDDLFYINLTTIASNSSLNLMKNRIDLEISTYPVWYFNNSFQAYFILKDYLGRLRTPDAYNISIWQNESNYTWRWSNNATIFAEGILAINFTLYDNLSSGVYWIAYNATLNGLNTSSIRAFRISATAYDISVIISTKEIQPSESVYFDVLLQNNGENEDDVHLTCSNYAEQKEEDILIQPHSQKTLSRSLITYENQEREQDSVNCFIRYANSRTASASDTYSILFKRVRHQGLIQIVREQKYFITPLSLLIVGGIVFGGYYYFGNGRLKKKLRILNKEN